MITSLCDLEEHTSCYHWIRHRFPQIHFAEFPQNRYLNTRIYGAVLRQSELVRRRVCSWNDPDQFQKIITCWLVTRHACLISAPRVSKITRFRGIFRKFQGCSHFAEIHKICLILAILAVGIVGVILNTKH